ncbi:MULTISPECIES: MATE family efflux transporter [Gammaproteobacteria]|uniref:MATE family efflux transporter n=1 Tax=Gammaproteobacteria TaxID=1236 RepID=UPI000DD0A35A|nr:MULTISPECIES: MATE family efflux transporter [Gammaproteobacteria]RTE87586.1 MATE family efflux transporter [Aliidiomarina sp. B3213]TCZ92630.1 MATE family efflux transporter [Lysobacter sp. N42]
MASAQASKAILNAPVGSKLWSMTWPVIFGVATLISFNFVDTFFISLIGTEELAAVGFTFPVSFTVISLTIGLGIGTSAVMARKLGGDDHEGARSVGSSALYLAAALVGTLAFIFFLLTDFIFTSLGATDSLMPLIKDYMYIWYAGAVLLVTPMVGNSILRASGDTKTPSFIMGVGGLLNAVLDPIFIFGLGPIPAMGIKGAALASVVSWSIGFSLIIYLLVGRKKLIDWIPASMQSFMESSRQLLKIGIPAAGANMLTPISAGVLTSVVANHGTAAVAAFGVGIRLESLASVVILALSMSLPPFISQNFGANKMGRVREAYRKSLIFILALQFFIYLALLALLPLLLAAFARDVEVAQVLAWFVAIMPLGYGLQGCIILTNSSFNALHLPMQALMVSIVRLFVMYVPISILGNWLYGLQGMFVGGVIANLLTAIIAYNWFMRRSHKGE